MEEIMTNNEYYKGLLRKTKKQLVVMAGYKNTKEICSDLDYRGASISKKKIARMLVSAR